MRDMLNPEQHRRERPLPIVVDMRARGELFLHPAAQARMWLNVAITPKE